MKLRIFGISDRATLEPRPETTLSASWQEDATNRWIDIEAATPDELSELLKPLELPPTVRESCLDDRRSQRVLSHPTALYLEVPTHLGWEQTDKPYISLLCLATTIITIHRDPSHTIEEIVRGLDSEAPLYGRNTSALLYYLLLQIGQANLDAALDVRAAAERLDQSCHDQPETLDPKEIAVLRQKMSHYAAVHDDHTYCAGVLQTVESEVFRVSEQPKFFHEMLRLSEFAGQLIDGAESRVSSLQRDYEMILQNRVNSRLQFLTILSAVFLPLTLISAIYGMNFDDLPAMHTPHGYLVVIGAMLATAILTAAYFYWKGWFVR
ncbi:MAG: magnesium transporter CorA family protein [Planctomycetaceae bacterium]|nr:magnesium transporter CorA family protein [Planctomycetaceae bacterium]